MKNTHTSSVQGLSFDDLVSRAKSSEPQLSPSALDGMVQRFEARLKLEAGAQSLHSGVADPSAAASRTGKLGAASKALLGGAGIAAVAAFIYGTTVGSTSAPALLPAQDTEAHVAPPAVPASSLAALSRSSADAPAAEVVANDSAPSVAQTNNGRSKSNLATTTSTTRLTQVRPRAQAPVASTQVAVLEAPTKQVEEATPQPAPVTKPVPALDTSLAQLERAERELRSGNSSAALGTLALPVVPSLSSRVEALRAVALCQSGQTAAGRRLGTQHLVRNPRSPYEQRLQRACGDL